MLGASEGIALGTNDGSALSDGPAVGGVLGIELGLYDGTSLGF